jgi:hypothetical protein
MYNIQNEDLDSVHFEWFFHQKSAAVPVHRPMNMLEASNFAACLKVYHVYCMYAEHIR